METNPIIGTLYVLGFAMAILGALVFVFELLATLSGDTSAVSMMTISGAGTVAGLLLIGFSKVIQKLYEIEYHLRTVTAMAVNDRRAVQTNIG